MDQKLVKSVLENQWLRRILDSMDGVIVAIETKREERGDNVPTDEAGPDDLGVEL